MSMDGSWTRVEQLGMYNAFGNAFANPDDYLAFIDANANALFADARRCHQTHGRGVVILMGPTPLIQSVYAIPEPHELTRIGPTAVEDFEGYDPAREMLIGLTDPAESYLSFWRVARR